MPFKDVESDWLDFLHGESPLLSGSETEYIAKVRCCIIKESESQPSFSKNSHLKQKLTVMKDNFKKIIGSLKKNLDSKNHFLRKYRKWRNLREKSYLQMHDIATSVSLTNQTCSYHRIIGSIVSLVGGLICLFTGDVAFRLLAIAFIVLGSLFIAMTSKWEADLLEENIKKAKKIIEEDKIYSVELLDWVSDLSFTQEALDIIRSINVDVDMKKAASDFYAAYKAESNEWKMMVEKELGFFEFSPEVKKEVADVVGILIATYMIYDHYHPYFNVEACNLNKILSSASDEVFNIAKISSIISVGKLNTFLRILRDIVSDIMNIIRELKNASTVCKEAEKITEAAKKLEEERNKLDNLYSKLPFL